MFDLWGQGEPIREEDRTLFALLRGGRWSSSPGARPPLSPSRSRLLPPIPDPDKIICIGLNYKTHAAEAGLEPPAAPTFFTKFRTRSPPTARVAVPADSDKVDYEAEVAFVIGRDARTCRRRTRSTRSRATCC